MTVLFVGHWPRPIPVLPLSSLNGLAQGYAPEGALLKEGSSDAGFWAAYHTKAISHLDSSGSTCALACGFWCPRRNHGQDRGTTPVLNFSSDSSSTGIGGRARVLSLSQKAEAYWYQKMTDALRPWTFDFHVAQNDGSVHGTGSHDKIGRHCTANDPNGKLNIAKCSTYWLKDAASRGMNYSKIVLSFISSTAAARHNRVSCSGVFLL